MGIAAKVKMKAGIYDPHLDTLGGGERYCLSLAELLLGLNWSVDFFWQGRSLTRKLKERLGFEAERVSFVPMANNILKKILNYPKYDLLFHISDGSIPFMFGKKNILHFQIPLKNVGGHSFLNQLKFKSIHKIVCNSCFTQKIIEKEYGVKSEVIYPPVETDQFKPGKKENLIIFVGRFSQLLQEKRQDILIEAFKKFYGKETEDWRLVLAGGSEIGTGDFIKELKKSIKGHPIEIKENISLKELTDLYARANFFWAASGFGIDEEKEPQKVEHFGITVVEAMAAGAIPLLVRKGGFKEIIEENKNGFFWESPEELANLSKRLAVQNNNIIRKEAIKRSKIFSKRGFNEKFSRIIF